MKFLNYIFISIVFFSSSIITAQSKTPIVLELFTSQGCSSCPPADDLLQSVKENYSDVYVLSYHVDYWNRLGWKDPFSKADFSKYQVTYCRQLQSKYTYTPQLVINGKEHFNGADARKTRAAIKKYSTTNTVNPITLSLVSKKSSEVQLNYQTTNTSQNIVFALVVNQRTTKVSRGENSHRTLTNSNIVANQIITNATKNKVTIAIPNWVLPSDELSVIAYSKNKYLEVTGATKLKI